MSQLKRNIAGSYLGLAVIAAMGLVFVPAYISYLGMEAYGLLGLFAVMHATLALIDAGVPPTLNREVVHLKAGAHSAQSVCDLLRRIELVCLGFAIAITPAVWSWMPTTVFDPASSVTRERLPPRQTTCRPDRYR